MLTAERLNKWGMNVDPTCELCRSYFEDRDHLFAKCSYGNQLWNRLLNWIGQPSITPQSWTQHLEWSLTRGKGKSAQARIFRMLNAEIVHAIWNERSMRIFEKRSREIESLAREIAYTCSARATHDVNRLIHNFQF
uniref:Orf147a protein n=1 Tax=Solanum tuberosum TaxID=4113 RepID=M1BN74_SOLTU